MARFIAITRRVRSPADPRIVGLLVCIFLQGAAIIRLPGAAQSLRVLHVRDFSMVVDRSDVAVGERFHLTIHAGVAEEVTSLDEIGLPNLSAFEELGDERRCSATQRGTECFETLTLDAATEGDVMIAPATLDAVDGRTGRPSRFQTNPVRMRIVPEPFKTAVQKTLAQAAWLTLRIVALGVLLVAAAVALMWLRGRARRIRPVTAEAGPAAPELDPDARLRELARTLAREPTRSHAAAVRAALRRRAGARDDETLADLAIRGALHGRDGAALSAVERASFCEDECVAEAAREALSYLP